MRGRNPRLPRKRAEEIFKLADLSVGITGEEKVVSLEIELLLDELKRIEKSIDKIDSEAKAIVEEREEYPLLISIPGVGPITASSIIAEIGEITNFSSRCAAH